MSMLYKNAGARIRLLRKEQRMTRDELSEKCNVTSKFLYEIEVGKKGFSAETLYDISKALGVSCDYILTGEKLEVENKERLTNLHLFERKDIDCVNDILRLLYMLINDKSVTDEKCK